MFRSTQKPIARPAKRALALACAAAFLGLATQHSDAADKIRVGAPPFYSSMLVFIAQKLGYWKDAGLDVEITQFPGGSLVNQAVLSGSIDMGMGVGAGPAVALAATGARILVVAPEAYTDTSAPPEQLVVGPNSKITDIKQLNGKLIAVHAKGTLSHILLEAIDHSVGIKPVVLEIPVENQWVALKRGDVDAVMTETPFPEQMKAEGGRFIYDLPRKGVVSYLADTVSITTRKFATEHPDTLTKAIEVSLRTARWIMANPEKARDMIGGLYKYKPETIKLISPESFKWSLNGTFPINSMRWWGAQMKLLGVIRNEPDYAKYFVTDYVDAALKDMGKKPDPDFERLIAQPIAN